MATWLPVTPGGRVAAGFVMLIGIAMFAVPAGILATGFANEIRKRDFLATWRMVARLPLLAELDAARIGSIVRLLRAQTVPAKTVVARRGDRAEAMFFLVEGEVEIAPKPEPVRLTSGQFFGEIALLKDTQRTATVTAATACRLLVLDVADFR